MTTKKTTTAHKAKAAKKPASKKTAKPAAAKDNKTTALIAMLTKGATAEHMAKTLGWLPHTLRAALSRLKTKEGLKIARERGRRHHELPLHLNFRSLPGTPSRPCDAGAFSFWRASPTLPFGLPRSCDLSTRPNTARAMAARRTPPVRISRNNA